MKKSGLRIRVATIAVILCVAVLSLFAVAAFAAPRAATIDTVAPQGVSMKLFDYWVGESQDSADNEYSPNPEFMRGINAGSGDQNDGFGHALKFFEGESGEWDLWTTTWPAGNEYPQFQTSDAAFLSSGSRINQYQADGSKDIVSDTLVDEYPYLEARYKYGALRVKNADESLSYLFSDSAHTGKASYEVTNPNLFTIDPETGNYTYDSSQNFAQFNEATGDFTVYDTFGGYDGQSNGGFFPFNSGNEVGLGLSEGQEGAVDVQESSVLNHYFGMNMDFEFVQPTGGVVGDNPMKFSFTGDDDVWIYVDGVLVLDLGGIHGSLSGEINFQTGEVTCDGMADTTLRALLEAQGVDAEWGTGNQVNTFADATHHTLQLFYLERGNGGSTLKLSFNLKQLPEPTLHLVDDAGNTVPHGAEYDLYTAAVDGSGTWTKTSTSPVLHVSVDENGQAHFRNEDGSLFDFAGSGTDRFIMETTNVASGYRAPANSFHLRYEEESHVLLVDNFYENGGFGSFSVQASPEGQFETQDGTPLTNEQVANGTAYALVMYKGEDGQWYGVTGSNDQGWDKLETPGIEAALAGAQPLATSASSHDGHVDLCPADGLTNNSYWVVQQSAPAGYLSATTPVRVTVNDDGVWARGTNSNADAWVVAKAGELLQPNYTYAKSGIAPAPLYRVEGTLQTTSNLNNAWQDSADSGSIELVHDSDGAAGHRVEYVPVNEQGAIDTSLSDGFTVPVNQYGKMKLVQKVRDNDNPGDWMEPGTDVSGVFTGMNTLVFKSGSNKLTVSLDVDAVTGHALPTTLPQVTYTLTATSGTTMASGVTAVLLDAEGNVVQGSEQKLEGNGPWKITANMDQQVMFAGAPNGFSYNVQAALADGSTTEAGAWTFSEALDATTADGSNETHVFDVTYKALPTNSSALEGVFELTGEGAPTPEDRYFRAVLSAYGADAPLPSTEGNDHLSSSMIGDTSALVAESQAAGADGRASYSFGSVAFENPGTYTYHIRDYTNQPGVTAAADYYHVIITVTDENGVLSAEITYQLESTDGNPGQEAQSPDFVDAYSAHEYTISLRALVTLHDEQGRTMPIEENKFQFQIAPYTGLVEGITNQNPQNDPLAQGGSVSAAKDTGTASLPVTFASEHVNNMYYYTVRQMVNGAPITTETKQGSYVYDAHTALIKIEVISADATNSGAVGVIATYYNNFDPDSGTLGEAVSGSALVASFANRYEPTLDGAKQTVSVTKTLEGRTLNEGEFSFGLSEGTHKNSAASGTGWYIESAVAGTTYHDASTFAAANPAPDAASPNEATFEVAHLTFYRPGEYTFEVWENKPTGQTHGVTYDSTLVQTVVVTVEDDNNGNLVASKRTIAGQDIAAGEKLVAHFTNSYSAQGIFSGLPVEITKTGQDAKANEFAVQAVLCDDQGQPVQNSELALLETTATSNAAAADSAQTVTLLNGSTLSRAGSETYYVLVSQQLPTDDNTSLEGVQTKGVTHDERQYLVQLHAEDDGKGIHTITALPVKVRDSASEAWSELAQDAQKVVFKNDYASVPSNASDDAAFMGLVASGEKVVHNQTDPNTAINPAGYSFTITADAQAPSEMNVDATGVATSNNQGHFSFEEYFKNAHVSHAGHTHEFLIEENAVDQAAHPGVTKSSDTYTLTISTRDNNDGTLGVDYDLKRNPGGDTAQAEAASAIIFENTYAVPADVETQPVDLEGTYTLDVLDARVGEFAFTLEALKIGATGEHAPMPQGATGNMLTVQNTAVAQTNGVASGSFDFGSVTFNEPGEYYYKVTETAGDASPAASAIVYDNHVFYIAVEVQDTGLATLSTTVTYLKETPSEDGSEAMQEEANSVAFENGYHDPSGGVDVVPDDPSDNPDDTNYNAVFALLNSGIKTVTNTTGDTAVSPAGYEFVIAGLDGAPLAQSQQSATVKSADDGTFSFASAFDGVKITAGSTLQYEITETPSTNSAITSDTASYLLTITAAATPSGTVITPTLEKAESAGGTYTAVSALAFENTYAAASVSTDVIDTAQALAGQVIWDANAALAEDDIEVTLSPVGGAPEPEDGVLELHPMSGTGAVGTAGYTFDALTFTHEGTYTYTVEAATQLHGFYVDVNRYEVTFTVSDSSGVLAISNVKREAILSDGNTATVSADQGLDFAFTYAPDTTTATISGAKVLTGRDMQAGEFTFELTGVSVDGDTGEAPSMPASTTVEVASGTANVNTSFSFLPITYTKAGTYVYTVSEQPGTDTEITYDNASFEVEVVVSDTNGVLSAQVNYPDGSPVFRNTWTEPVVPDPTPIDVVLSGSVGLEGRSITADEFSFWLKDAAGVEVETVHNSASGAFSFAALSFDAVGEYDYTVSQVAGSEQGMTYDMAVHDVHVSVTEQTSTANAPLLVATVTIDGKPLAENPIIFRNVWEDPSGQDPDPSPGGGSGSGSDANQGSQDNSQGGGVNQGSDVNQDADADKNVLAQTGDSLVSVAVLVVGVVCFGAVVVAALRLQRVKRS